jgi:PadR family transcriptional regulator PadR
LGDAETVDKKFCKELSSGITSLALLGILATAEEPMYGYQIASQMGDEEESGFVLIKHGALYPVLRSLEKNDLLSSTVEPSVSGPPRRYYRITEEGMSALARWTETWKCASALVDGILGGVRDV